MANYSGIIVNRDYISNALAEVLNSIEIIAGDIAWDDDGESWTLAVLTEHEHIMAYIEKDDVQGFTVVKDSVEPEKAAAIALAVMISDDRFHSLKINYDDNGKYVEFHFDD